ncbi:MAG: hypothetical protein ACQEW8_04450 [Actinomycetota bacterium]
MTSIAQSPGGSLRVTRQDNITVGSQLLVRHARVGERMHIVSFEHQDGATYMDIHRIDPSSTYCGRYCRSGTAVRRVEYSELTGAWMHSSFCGLFDVIVADYYAVELRKVG